MVENSQLGDKAERALMETQRKVYVGRQKRADLFGRVAGYLFWVATSTMMATAVGMYKLLSTTGASEAVKAVFTGGGLDGAVATITGLSATSGIPVVGVAILGAVSVAALAGSILTSRKAKEIMSESNIVFSELDSKIKSKGMVQEFAKTQYNAKQQTKALQLEPAAIDGAPQTPWAERVQQQTSTRSAALAETKTKTTDWAEYIAKQAQEEDLQKLANLQSGRGA